MRSAVQRLSEHNTLLSAEKILATQAGEAPDASLASSADLRPSLTNNMSVPLLPTTPFNTVFATPSHAAIMRYDTPEPAAATAPSGHQSDWRGDEGCEGTTHPSQARLRHHNQLGRKTTKRDSNEEQGKNAADSDAGDGSQQDAAEVARLRQQLAEMESKVEQEKQRGTTESAVIRGLTANVEQLSRQVEDVVLAGRHGDSKMVVLNPPESARSYSSADHRQSMLDSPQAWSSRRPVSKEHDAGKEFLVMDLGQEMRVGGVVIQAREDQPEYVTEVEVLHTLHSLQSAQDLLSRHDEQDQIEQQLDQAGAKSGEITVSLIWENSVNLLRGADLDLCTDCPGGQINYQQRQIGRGFLDIDNQGTASKGGSSVKNMFWDSADVGKFRVHVKNNTEGTRTTYTVRFTSRTVVRLLGPEGDVLEENFMGSKTFTGSVLKPENPTVCYFEVEVEDKQERARRAAVLKSRREQDTGGLGGLRSLGRFVCPATFENKQQSLLLFQSPVHARCIKIVAWDWVSHISMRAGILQIQPSAYVAGDDTPVSAPMEAVAAAADRGHDTVGGSMRVEGCSEIFSRPANFDVVGTLSGAYVSRRSIDARGHPHPTQAGLCIFAVHDDSGDTKMVGANLSSHDPETACMFSDHHRVVNGLVDLTNSSAVVAAWEGARREMIGKTHTVMRIRFGERREGARADSDAAVAGLAERQAREIAELEAKNQMFALLGWLLCYSDLLSYLLSFK